VRPNSDAAPKVKTSPTTESVKNFAKYRGTSLRRKAGRAHVRPPRKKGKSVGSQKLHC